jgi:hypothetical protein
MQKTNAPAGAKKSKDLPDSPDDKKEMREPEMIFIDLPDVKDIPGQENIVPAPLGEMADETTASSDEEGDELFADDIDTEIEESPGSNVSPTEKEDLQMSTDSMSTEDDINLRKAALDNTDDEGSQLNEGNFSNDVSGVDLDVPGAEDDDDDEAIGEEDEENNEYSLGGDNHDDIPEDNF